MSAKPNRGSLRLHVVAIHDHIPNYGYEYTIHIHDLDRTVRLLRCAGYASEDAAREDAKRREDEVIKAARVISRYSRQGVRDTSLQALNQKGVINDTPR